MQLKRHVCQFPVWRPCFMRCVPSQSIWTKCQETNRPGSCLLEAAPPFACPQSPSIFSISSSFQSSAWLQLLHTSSKTCGLLPAHGMFLYVIPGYDTTGLECPWTVMGCYALPYWLKWFIRTTAHINPSSRKWLSLAIIGVTEWLLKSWLLLVFWSAFNSFP